MNSVLKSNLITDLRNLYEDDPVAPSLFDKL